MNNENEQLGSNHSINIIDRKIMSLSGVTKIKSFDSEEFIIDTVYGRLGVKGQGLEIVKLDTYAGTLSIKGSINAFSYLTKEKVESEGFIARLFK